jgi:biotin carboxylase
MRAALLDAGLPVPPFARFDLRGDPEVAAEATRFPCVLKPLIFSASRGVIRADDPPSFVAAWRRIAKLLHDTRAERRARGEDEGHEVLVEGFVPGAEVAVEGLLRAGTLEVLALFDKPDPLDGPFFEETLYVTPSRHPAALQREIERVTAEGARALGLAEGPLHAELRLPPSGPVILEIAARSIGGLCSRTLRFGAGLTLEEVLVAHAMGLPLDAVRREARAAGVMMLPIPRRGVLHGVSGVEAARAVPGVVDVVITAETGRELVPLPEGDSYLGFLFAKGDRPEDVEAALRAAHARLGFDLRAPLPTLPR